MAARALLILLFAGGCATAPLDKVPQQCTDRCRAVLDLRDKTMKRFERLCIALAYVGARYYGDRNIQQEVKEGMMICTYIYGSRHRG